MAYENMKDVPKKDLQGFKPIDRVYEHLDEIVEFMEEIKAYPENIQQRIRSGKYFTKSLNETKYTKAMKIEINEKIAFIELLGKY